MSSKIPLVNTVKNFSGGKIKHSVAFWKRFKLNKEIINIINGKVLEFDSSPIQYHIPNELKLNKTEALKLDETIKEFLSMDIVEPCEEEETSFFSNVFIKTKDDSSARLLFDLRELNEHIVKESFKTDSIYDVLNLTFPGAWFCKLDLKHAYFSIPIRVKDRKFLKFKWRRRIYRYTCLPQGLTSAARKFTKLMKVPIAHFRALGMNIVIYLDDLIFIAASPSELIKQIRYAISILDLMGLTVNLAKSILTPVQIIDYIGFTLNSKEMTIKLTEKRCKNIRNLGRKLLKKSKCSIRRLSSFIGHLVSSEAAIPLAPLYYKHLEILKNEMLKRHKGNYNAFMTLREQYKIDIEWWVNIIHKQINKINTPNVTHHLYVDASMIGWGAVLGESSTHGHWDQNEVDHINILELKSILLALKSLCKDLHGSHIRIHTDNTTALMCIQKRGSNKRKFLELTKEIYQWAKLQEVKLSATHVKGIQNRADIESRKSNADTEWMMKPHIFQHAIEIFNKPKIDLFASRINCQLKRYVSWLPDPDALYTDAFTIAWDKDYNYAFPPFSLIGRVLRKICDEKAEVLAVLPVWPSATWFTLALGLLCRTPRLLPRGSLMLPQQPERRHRLEPSLKLAVWRLSGDASSNSKYRKKCQDFSYHHGGSRLLDNTAHTLKNGCHFVYREKLIPFIPL